MLALVDSEHITPRSAMCIWQHRVCDRPLCVVAYKDGPGKSILFLSQGASTGQALQVARSPVSALRHQEVYHGSHG